MGGHQSVYLPQLAISIVISQSGDIQWKAKGNLVKFKGYSKYWQDIKADSELPALQQQQILTLAQADAEQKTTQPPSRYSEPKLVQYHVGNFHQNIRFIIKLA